MARVLHTSAIQHATIQPPVQLQLPAQPQLLTLEMPITTPTSASTAASTTASTAASTAASTVASTESAADELEVKSAESSPVASAVVVAEAHILANPEITFEDVAAVMQPPIARSWVRNHAALIGRNVSAEYQKIHGKKAPTHQTIMANGRTTEIKTYHESDREIIRKVLRTLKAYDDLPVETKEEIRKRKNREAQARAKAKKKTAEAAAVAAANAAAAESNGEDSADIEQFDA